MLEKNLAEAVGLKMTIDGLVARKEDLRNCTFDVFTPSIAEQNGLVPRMLGEYLNLDQNLINEVCRRAIHQELERLIEANRQELKKLGVKLMDEEIETAAPVKLPRKKKVKV